MVGLGMILGSNRKVYLSQADYAGDARKPGLNRQMGLAFKTPRVVNDECTGTGWVPAKTIAVQSRRQKMA